jgi:hypothetical protein
MKALEYIINSVLWLKIHLLILFNFTFNKKSLYTPQNNELMFYDDFNKSQLLRDLWRTDYVSGIQVDPKNIIEQKLAPDVIYTEVNHIMSNSKVYLYTKKELIKYTYPDHGTYLIPFTSGQITQNKFKQKYGYFEANLSLPPNEGTVPEFLLTTESGKQISILNTSIKSKNDFNTWGCKWKKNCIKIYYNSFLIKVIFIKIDEPMYITIRNGVNIIYGNKIESPNFVGVDWVKVWKN